MNIKLFVLNLKREPLIGQVTNILSVLVELRNDIMVDNCEERYHLGDGYDYYT